MFFTDVNKEFLTLILKTQTTSISIDLDRNKSKHSKRFIKNENTNLSYLYCRLTLD